MTSLRPSRGPGRAFGFRLAGDLRFSFTFGHGRRRQGMVLRAATAQRNASYNDFHGKTYGAVSLGQIRRRCTPRASGMHMVPRPDVPSAVARTDGSCDTEKFLSSSPNTERARWRRGRLCCRSKAGPARSCSDDFFPAARLLPEAKDPAMADEVLTSWGVRAVAGHGTLGRVPTWSPSARGSATDSRYLRGGARAVSRVVRDDFASSSYGNPMACAVPWPASKSSKRNTC